VLGTGLDLVTAADVAGCRSVPDDQIRALEFGGQLTTPIDQVTAGLNGQTNLPPAKVYEQAIVAEL